MPIYLLGNFAMQTTAAPVPVATGTAIKTMLQFKASATLVARVMEWGYSFDSGTAALSGKIELIESDVAATVTALAAADITKIDGDALMGGDPTTNLIQVGTTATGFTSTAEGTTTAIRNLDGPQFETTLTSSVVKFSKQFPLDQEPIIQVGKFARIRVTFSTTTNMYCWLKIRV